MSHRTLILAPILLAASSLAAAEVGDRWPLVAFDSQDDCQLSLTSSGRAIQIRASGLIPGETLRFSILNGDMTPIAYTLRASGDGTVQRYYFPFRLNREGGTVEVTIDAARCRLSASAPWTRNLATLP